MRLDQPIVVMVSGKPTVATLVSEASKTVCVRLRDGRVVKRHRVKHHVGTIGATA